MIRKLIVGVFLILVGKSYACDVCGCSFTSQSFGILPKFQSHYFGVRYGYKSFSTFHPALLSTDAAYTSQEHFQSWEFWTKWQLGKRWQLFGFIPYQWGRQKVYDSRITNHGLGDVSVAALYSILSNRITASGKYVQNAQIGLGLSLPTGTSGTLLGGAWEPSLQNGTGSLDYSLNVNYVGRWDHWAFQMESGWRFHGKSREPNFILGQRGSSYGKVFYYLSGKKVTFLPSIGLSGEYMLANKHENVVVEGTNGYVVSGLLGVDIFTNRFGFGCSIVQALHHDLGGGNINPGVRVQSNIFYFF